VAVCRLFTLWGLRARTISEMVSFGEMGAEYDHVAHVMCRGHRHTRLEPSRAVLRAQPSPTDCCCVTVDPYEVVGARAITDGSRTAYARLPPETFEVNCEACVQRLSAPLAIGVGLLSSSFQQWYTPSSSSAMPMPAEFPAV